MGFNYIRTTREFLMQKKTGGSMGRAAKKTRSRAWFGMLPPSLLSSHTTLHAVKSPPRHAMPARGGEQQQHQRRQRQQQCSGKRGVRRGVRRRRQKQSSVSSLWFCV